LIAVWTEKPIDDSEKVVGKIAELYSLISGFSFRYQQAGATGIQSVNDLGNPHPSMTLTSQALYTKEQLRKRTADLKARWQRTCNIWNKLQEKLETSKRQYLRIALFAHYQSGLFPSMPLEDAYINATIGLEALYNENPQDISYKLATRGALILTASTKNTPIGESYFRALKHLYTTRNKIVHGGGAKVTYNELHFLRLYLRESLRSCLALDLNKKDLIVTIDDALTDEKVRTRLIKNLHHCRKLLGFKARAML